MCYVARAMQYPVLFPALLGAAVGTVGLVSFLSPDGSE